MPYHQVIQTWIVNTATLLSTFVKKNKKRVTAWWSESRLPQLQLQWVPGFCFHCPALWLGLQRVSGHSVIQLLVSMILLLPESPGLPFSSMSLPSGRTCLLQSPSSLFLKRLEPNPLPLSLGQLDCILTVTAQ